MIAARAALAVLPVLLAGVATLTPSQGAHRQGGSLKAAMIGDLVPDVAVRVS